MDDRCGAAEARPEAIDAGAAAGEEACLARGAEWRGGERPGLPAEEELVAAARAAHERRAGPMTLEVFERLTPFKTWQVSRVFQGGWTELRGRAGIPLHPRELNRLGDEELLAEYHRVACGLGQLPEG